MLNSSWCWSMKAYFTSGASRSTPRPFLGWPVPPPAQPVAASGGRSRLPVASQPRRWSGSAGGPCASCRSAGSRSPVAGPPRGCLPGRPAPGLLCEIQACIACGGAGFFGLDCLLMEHLCCEGYSLNRVSGKAGQVQSVDSGLVVSPGITASAANATPTATSAGPGIGESAMATATAAGNAAMTASASSPSGSA